MAPGSSLGGARPKANILDENNELWIAKFPSKNDTLDNGAWEYLAYQLAVGTGIPMSPSKIEKIAGNHHTFRTKRFDREKRERIHFASAFHGFRAFFEVTHSAYTTMIMTVSTGQTTPD